MAKDTRPKCPQCGIRKIVIERLLTWKCGNCRHTWPKGC